MAMDDGLRPLFRERIQAHWQSIETGGTGRGVPDSNVCLPSAGERWIEFKATAGWAVTLRPEQIGWLVTRERHGGVTFVAVRRRCDAGPRRGGAVDELHLYRGFAARELKVHGLQHSSLIVPHEARVILARAHRGLWQGGPSRWPLPEIRDILATG
jgi:hypothetical protein